MPDSSLNGVPKQDLTSQLLGRFKELISQGVLRPGAKLAAERDLARQFGVSRSSLRHALKVLQTMGVITQRVGDGTYLTTSAARTLSEPLQFLVLLDGITAFDLIETRLIVEPELAARAAERATAEDLATMCSTTAQRAGELTKQQTVELDLTFHQTIFHASGNLLCSRLFTLIHRSMATVMALSSQLVDWEYTLRLHRPIYEAIAAGKPEEARHAMYAHLTDTRRLLMDVGEWPERIEVPPTLAPLVPSLRRASKAERS